jgi:hypothetical protein
MMSGNFEGRRWPPRGPLPPPLPAPVRAARRIFNTIAITVVILTALASLAPKLMNKPVPPSHVQSAGWTPSGQPCSPDGGVAKAVEISDAGPYPLYRVTCADGVITTTAGP